MLSYGESVRLSFGKINRGYGAALNVQPFFHDTTILYIFLSLPSSMKNTAIEISFWYNVTQVFKS